MSAINTPAPSDTSFSDDFNITWYRTPLERKVLKQLMQRNDLRGWLQTIGHLGLFFTTAILSYWVYSIISVENWPWMTPLLLLTLFLHGTIGPFMGLIAVHELQHRTVFKSKALNSFFERLYAFISWSDYIWYQQSHARHHQATCHVDYDGEVVLPVKFSLRRWGTWLGWFAWNPKLSWQRLKPVWHHANGQLRGDWYNYVLPATDTKLRQRHKNWARTLLIGHAALAIMFVLSGYWFLIVVFTFGTFYCSWLGFLCGVAQHYGLNSDIPDFRYNTRTFTCSWLPAFYYWNMQYHLEHHMYPSVPFHNLPKLRQALEHELPLATHGLLATWKDMLKIRQKMLADPAFKYMPDVPS